MFRVASQNGLPVEQCACILVKYAHKERVVKKAAKPIARASQPADRVRETATAPYEATAAPSRGRRPVNLTLDRDAVERGERFARHEGVSLSTLVTGFLQSLPDPDAASALSLAPAVRRLYGLAAGHDLSRDDFRKFLARKYGVDADA